MINWLRNPWGKPRALVVVTVLYLAWAILPVAIAILFAFNDGRSRTTWQGFSFRWFTGEAGSVFHDPALQGALKHTLILGVLCVLVATPLGVALALGLQRWRGRGSGTVNTMMLLPLVTPEIVMGVALLLLFLKVLPGIELGTTAQAIGQVTFTLSYVVVIVRGRLVSIGPEYEEAAADLGAPPHDQLLRVLLPLLAPGDHRQRGSRVCAVARRLRRDAVPGGRREHDHRLDAALLDRPRCAEPRAQRPRDRRALHHPGDARTGLLRLQAVRRRGRRRRCRRTGGVTDMQGEIHLEELTKRFNDVVAVDAIDLHMPPGEFFTMVGPSGCGKTTTLRMIAGFERPTSGQIQLDGVDVAQVPAHKRNVNTVFQSYALFPHLDVAGNVGFGLKYQRVTKDEHKKRVAEALDLVQLGALGSRKPSQLSGGQQQRVALARALVLRPRVLLLDEPLGALDARLRKGLQVELKTLQAELGITFVFVTHDQEEALTMSDRIAVMNGGHVEQAGAPRDIYEEPLTEFVADFLGVSNMVAAESHPEGGSACTIQIGEQRLRAEQGATDVSGPVKVMIRPERIGVEPQGTAGSNRAAGHGRARHLRRRHHRAPRPDSRWRAAEGAPPERRQRA